jgi:ABC-type branched-subunit amino acid transport system ATPase component/branched-subunit amino acid ABC-type transport system permease component
MGNYIVFLVLGLANGAVYASLAIALVTTYRSSGVINFATGGIALLAAYWYAYLRQGQLFCPIPGLPVTFDVGTKLGLVPAAMAAVILAAVFGLLLYVVVFRPLRSSPAAARAVASVGVLLGIIGILASRFGTDPTIRVDSIFPTGRLTVGSIAFPEDRAWFAGSVVVVALVVTLLMRRTRFGLNTRAVADSEKGALLSALAPVRVASLNWMLSAATAAIAGILIAPIVPLVPEGYTLFVVPALAAALVGRLQSVVIATAGGLGIGMLQSEFVYVSSQHSWLPSAGVAELIPLCLILVTFVTRSGALPSRGSLPLQHRLGAAPRPQAILMPVLVFGGASVLILIMLGGGARAACITSLIFGILGLSIVVVTGYAGQISLAQLALAGAGGFLVCNLSSHSIPFPVAPLLAAVCAAAIGVLVGLPALRIRGLAVAVVTLSMAATLEAGWFRNVHIVSPDGVAPVAPKVFGLDLSVGSGVAFPRIAFGLVVLGAVIASAVGVAMLRRSALGSAMLATRANERAAAASGVNVVATKVAAFGIGAFLAGLAGALLAYRQTTVTFDSFTVQAGLGFFAVAYLAGITSITGGLLAGILASGGIVFYALNQYGSVQSWYEVIAGVGLVVAMVLHPQGIAGDLQKVVRRLRRRKALSETDIDLLTTRMPRVDVADIERLTAPKVRSETILKVDGVSVRYGGVVAVDDVSFDVSEGEIVGLIGPNGAGKTTLMDALSGFVPYSGEIRLAGSALEGIQPFRRVRRGLGRTFQGIDVYEDMTVLENVAVGQIGASGRTINRQDDVDEVVKLLHLDAVADRPVSELSQGQRQLVSIGRGLISRPRVILLDEPAAGLDSPESEWLATVLRRVRAAGLTIVLIEHDVNMVLQLCDRVVVLDFGRVLANDVPAVVRRDPLVSSAYFGAVDGAGTRESESAKGGVSL